MAKNVWVSFYFESNQCWGLCDTETAWQDLKHVYESHSDFDITKAKQGKSYPKACPTFGFRAEHNGDETLADFAKKNAMNL